MTRDATRQDAGHYHKLLTRTVERSSHDLGLIVFQKHNPQHLILACLYATIIQSTRECLTLMSEPTITLSAVMRSILEAYADLRAMLKDTDHGQRMVATFESEKRRHLQSMIKSTANPYHQGIAQHLDPKVELRKVVDEIGRLKQLGHRPMSNRDRFKWAELEYEYESYYWWLCLQSHNSLTALEARHVITFSSRAGGTIKSASGTRRAFGSVQW